MTISTFKRMVSSKRITLKDINKSTINAKYAVRGEIPILADKLKADLSNQPFDKIINANIGNPQQLKQKPLTWYRQVLSVLQYPALIDQVSFPSDVVSRAKEILSNVHSIGAYSHSQGDVYFRNKISDFISKRDNFPSKPENIYITSGASSAVNYLIQLLSKNEDSGFLIPIPQYPLYTAAIALNNSCPIPYYLQENDSWSVNAKKIEETITSSSKEIKAIVLINPGNPTGSILSFDDIKSIIDLSAKHNLIIIADEVYQENVFHGEFISVKKVLCELLQKDHDSYKNVQLASLHSISKGFTGECGQRGGYMELFQFDKEVENIVYKLASINLCSSVSGQALVELMVNPPQKGDPSYELYSQERSQILSDLKSRADSLFDAFSSMEYISCNKPMGAMYLFPKLDFPQSEFGKLFDHAKLEGKDIDEIYCIELLKGTGICTIPGNGFGQEEGTYHLRTTFLAPGTDWITSWSKFHKEFVAKYKS